MVRNFNSDLAGAIQYETYWSVDDTGKLTLYYEEELVFRMFRDENHNYQIDEGELVEDGQLYFYYGDTEISGEEYSTYQIPGDYQALVPSDTAEDILTVLQ